MSLLGVQNPRLSLVPEGDASRGEEAVQFASWCGLTLYPWQQDLLRDMCRTDERGRWAAREVVTVVARQNGKGEVLLARELAGVYLFGEKVIFHSAHFTDTAIDAMKRLYSAIECSEDLMLWWEDDPDTPGVPVMSKTNGKEAIIFPNGAMIYFRTRTKKTARGISADLLIFDECFDLPKETYSAMSKIVRAREFAQTVFISSPVNRLEHAHGAIFSAKRWAGIDGAKRTLFKEWSPDDDDDPFAQSTWAKCNPSMVDEGPGAQLDDIAADATSAQNSEALLDSFLIETLGEGDWCPRDGDTVDEFVPVLSADEIAEMTVDKVPLSTLKGLRLVIDASPDREACAVSIGGRRGDAVIGHVAWLGPLVVSDVVKIVLEVCEVVDPAVILVDSRNPAWSVAEKLENDHELEVSKLSFPMVKHATAAFIEGKKDGNWLFTDADGHIADAFTRAELKTDASGEVRWTRQSGVICQLTSMTYAMWSAAGAQHTPPPRKTGTHRARPVKAPASTRHMSF